MKRLIVSMLFLNLLVATAHAGPNQNGDRQGRSGSGDRMARMQQNLGLSDEQMTQMREIREHGGSREEMRAVLTDEQRAIMGERRSHSKGQRGYGRGDSPDVNRQPIETVND